MELETALRDQTVRNIVREVGINPNHWYAIARSAQLQPEKVLPVVFWRQSLAVFRDNQGQVHVLDDICPHKGVSLHKGTVQGCHLVCPYHGWEYDGASGECAAIPYLPEGQKLPRASVRSYPVQERYGLIWIFPGAPELADQKMVLDVPQAEEDGWLDVLLEAHFKAHFSICNENTMDVFHGHLHAKHQAWYDTKLVKLQETPDLVQAQYDVTYQNWLAPLLGLSERGNQVTTQRITIEYIYPHLRSSLGNLSRLYLLRMPVNEYESHSFGLFFFKVKIPRFLNPLKPLIRSIVVNWVLMKFLVQDIEMMEDEQQTYQNEPNRRYVEINPAILAMQRLIVRQFEQVIKA
ncbi:Rieske 2Fe-2S domain-containing protein [Leptolyngbya sp. FACHB-261]|uniref:aromatic ring-hydroxylating dioxygenase subunit alpha n=1 Tax=Leptolyngbya sp. FACHB-261 TaxID=2692806 RepID=UPI001682586D|nr:Rieske 2Fe-2S domain-containing protein [Leptolyngbya sp. FACHB-261]MBD2103702.1 aromatic ring-hydroxylating dioxygenase subunit alpha [Leptolyngbya sp. FACHB-261]